MKVIGLTADRGEYIATVSHDEVEKVMGQYYGKLQPLKVGQAVHLGAGYDYAEAINRACQQMVAANEAFGRARDTLLQFAKFAIAQNAEKKPLPAAAEESQK